VLVWAGTVVVVVTVVGEMRVAVEVVTEVFVEVAVVVALVVDMTVVVFPGLVAQPYSAKPATISSMTTTNVSGFV
jgi:hypothetical protein